MNSFALFGISYILCLFYTSSKTERRLFFNSETLSVWCSGKSPNILEDQVTPCPLPVAKLRSGRYKPATIGDYFTEPPSWLNVTLARIGQNYFRQNLVGFIYSTGLTSLLVGTTTDAIRVIASAGNITRPETAGRRYLGNLLHFIFWSQGDFLTAINNSRPAQTWNQSAFFESLNLIRSVHDRVSHQTYQYKSLYTTPAISKERDKVQLNDKLWKAFRLDLEASTLTKFKNNSIFPPRHGGTEYYLNQFSMMLQYWAFVALPIMKPASGLFLPPTDEEVKGYLHFWSMLGHVMGLQPEYNVMLQPDVETARIYFRQILEEYFVPAMFNTDYEFKVVLEVSIKGIGKIFPFVDESIALKQLCEDLLWIEPKNIRQILSSQARIYSWILNNFNFFTHYPYPSLSVKFIINGMIQVSAVKHLGFNILQPTNFTNGLLTYDEQVLDSVSLWYWLNDTKPNASQNSAQWTNTR